jgi:predicted dehydrogenase/nucleoside-diphosphate-sugar epimerase
VGVADPAASEESLRPVVGRDALIVQSVRQLLEEARPDVVHIVTPPATHSRLALQALEAGCHVYVEKPFTLTASEARDVLDAAANRKLLVTAGHQVLFEKPALEAMASLGDIGRLVHVESHFSFRMVRRTITPVEQCKDILPHAVYPLLQQLRAGSGDTGAPIEIHGVVAKASGDLYALVEVGNCTGILEVSLSGRPVEQYQHLIGTNGSLRADFVTGSVVRLSGPGAGIGVLFTPYRRALQTIGGANRGFAKLIFGGQGSYPGLQVLAARFYDAVAGKGPPPMTSRQILDTVETCERLGKALDEAEAKAEQAARIALEVAAAQLPAPHAGKPVVLVTGGTGMLGRPVAQELRHAGYPTRVLARRTPPPSRCVPGVEYVAGNLATGLEDGALAGVGVIVHCAAETAGGKEDQERNSIQATRNVMEAARRVGISRVIHVSSLAVLRTGRDVGGALSESTPVDSESTERGPYVWGKAQSELLASRLADEYGIGLRIVRPGPLVDYQDFQPPGRLGREAGPWFIAIGSKKAPLSVCDVQTAARVIRSYLDDFDAAPAVLNMVEGVAPTRGELVERLLSQRRDLKARWIPDLVVRLANGPAKLAQRMLLGSQKPIDVHAAFASERYDTTLAATVIARAGANSVAANS